MPAADAYRGARPSHPPRRRHTRPVTTDTLSTETYITETYIYVQAFLSFPLGGEWLGWGEGKKLLSQYLGLQLPGDKAAIASRLCAQYTAGIRPRKPCDVLWRSQRV